MSHEDALNRVSDYIQAELEASLLDNQFITKLNRMTAECFKDYVIVAEKIATNIYKMSENQEAKAR